MADLGSQAHLLQDAQTSPSSMDLDTGIRHDIFLSHSGAQKGFVKDLYHELRQTFSTFFDVAHHSLPVGEHFPTHIFQAAKSCDLAIVVLSDEFVCSKWPMIELSIFVDAMPSGLKLLPLFFKLSPADLKCSKNLKRWRKLWKAHERQDNKHRIDASKWAYALQILGSQNGLLFEQASDGEQSYIKRIVLAISQIVPPAFKFDTTYIFGKDRLCKVILDKFKEMKLCQSGVMDHSSVSPSFTSQPGVSVLGLYGLPGSGKSTLCKCLLDHFRPFYGSTKALYLEFPSTPSDAEVVEKLKELLRLTDFRNRVELDRASNLEHVEHLLKTSRLSSCKVFLVVDNISDKSWHGVQRILFSGVGQGSKIILVAHSVEVLLPILHLLEFQLHWACDSIAAPSINEMEATQILMQSVRVRDLFLAKVNLTDRQREIIQSIVRMCGFYVPTHGVVQLPLVIKAMGARLLKYDGADLERWQSDIESFCMRVKSYKQSAVIEELLGENFQALPNEHLQLLFLDVALFIMHFEKDVDTVSSLLSMMHGFTSSRIRMMIKDLERHCFLGVSKDGIVSVHEVYMEFAKSIQDGPSKYLNSTMSWCWKHCDIMYAEAGSNLTLQEDQGTKAKGSLRALVLDVAESCKRVDLQGFSGLKAVVLRNCKSLVVLGLAGLSSLVILEIRNCAVFRRLECNDSNYSSLLNVKRCCIFNQSPSMLEEKCEAHVQAQGQALYLNSVVNVLKRVIAPFRQPDSLDMGLIASRMKSLQVLHLENSGIRSLEHVGINWPQLQDLTIVEQHLDRLELGYLPKLTQFVFCDSGEIVKSYDCSSNFSLFRVEGLKYESTWRWKKGKSRLLLPGKDLLLGCSQLKRVTMQSAFFKEGQLGSLPAGLVSFEMHCFYAATELPDLSLSARTLQRLDVAWCENLERVNLNVGFKSITTLVLWECMSLGEVNGLASLPSLCVLDVSHCWKLSSLIGFDNSKMLECLLLVGCPKLREISCFDSLTSLEKLKVLDCPGLDSSIARAHLCDLVKLRECAVQVCGQCCFSLRDCKNLENFCVFLVGENGTDSPRASLRLQDLDNLERLGLLWIFGLNTSTSLGEGVHESPNLRFSSMVGVSNVEKRFSSLGPEALPGGGFLPSIRSLSLEGLGMLDNMDGIQHLGMLKEAHFLRLENLRSLQGVESLIQLQHLVVGECPVLEELPSLHALMHMKYLSIHECPKLKAVEGCDSMKLIHATFDGCISMEHFPFNHWRALGGVTITFRGCKFASNVEALSEWALQEAAPRELREASLFAMLWEYYHPFGANAHNKSRVAEALLRCVVQLMLATDDDCLDFTHVEEAWIATFPTRRLNTEYPWIAKEAESSYAKELQERASVEAAVQELGLRVRSKQKKVLLQEFHNLIHFLDDHRVSNVMSNPSWRWKQISSTLLAAILDGRYEN